MAKRKKKGKSILPAFMLLVLFLPVFALAVPTVVFLLFALMPTLVAMLVEDARSGYKWVCIFGLNISGAMPYLFDLWTGVTDMETVFNLLTNVGNLLVIYGGAVIGWLIYLLLPPVVSSIITHTDKSRVVRLRGEQEKLVQKWGEEVSMPG